MYTYLCSKPHQTEQNCLYSCKIQLTLKKKLFGLRVNVSIKDMVLLKCNFTQLIILFICNRNNDKRTDDVYGTNYKASFINGTLQ